MPDIVPAQQTEWEASRARNLDHRWPVWGITLSVRRELHVCHTCKLSSGLPRFMIVTMNVLLVDTCAYISLHTETSDLHLGHFFGIFGLSRPPDSQLGLRIETPIQKTDGPFKTAKNSGRRLHSPKLLHWLILAITDGYSSRQSTIGSYMLAYFGVIKNAHLGSVLPSSEHSLVVALVISCQCCRLPPGIQLSLVLS